jgi:hypothetical protein
MFGATTTKPITEVVAEGDARRNAGPVQAMERIGAIMPTIAPAAASFPAPALCQRLVLGRAWRWARWPRSVTGAGAGPHAFPVSRDRWHYPATPRPGPNASWLGRGFYFASAKLLSGEQCQAFRSRAFVAQLNDQSRPLSAFG